MTFGRTLRPCPARKRHPLSLDLLRVRPYFGLANRL